MKSVFQLKQIQYKDILQVEHMDIPLHRITCIVGESGSGKTTLLKMLNALISPTQGEIYFQEERIQDMDSVQLRRKVIMLGQNPVVFPSTIRDNFHAALGFSERALLPDQKLEEYLRMVHLNKSLDQTVESLSGGERQRLALARVFALDPEVLLLDEPSSALDEETEIFIIEETVNYAKKFNKTVIMVTHSKLIAEIYGENIIKISKGRYVREEGQ
ncbi:putative ABC transport system ATP-binding protein [Anaerosolibacter carboniphilus]|uniref:Putative ABC transport system ATP-binding protein n=1 Tax=Anaerosolibacter carboniphilus TaxID=1417629 RepID=A0A841L0B6_9FIRM|nr:ATP-binding cassette domain-containing protein [Anaerosolibacter carboniphilus]MBB6218993.1 putative ABC transport system ATP-binding protein [Anaerosolibacter carboniphilus]